MNLREKEMFHLLCQGRDEYGFTHVRAEFEAEGTRVEELLRLIDIGYKAGLNLALKISGCESLTGLYWARQAGASILVAPMIESVYALKKYALSCQKVFPLSAQYDTRFYFNIETVQAYHLSTDLILTSSQEGLHGVVFGRVDFTASMGLQRSFIESDMVTDKIKEVAEGCKKLDQAFILGGAVSSHTIKTLSRVNESHLNHFETRKIIFDKSILSQPSLLHKGLTRAGQFELLWLKNKQSYYQTIQGEDYQRILLLENRLNIDNL